MTRRVALAGLALLLAAGCGADTDAAPGDAARVGLDQLESNKAVARRWFEDVINQRDLDAIPEIYAPDYVYHGPEAMDMSGLDEVRAFAAAILAASDDRRAVVEQQVAEGDLVATRFTSRGTMTGPWQGRDPTGEAWITEGLVISRVEDGKIVEDWEITHQSGL